MATPSSCSHSSFHLFPFLPAELRLQIWRLVPQSRVVTLSYLPSPDRNEDTYTYYTPTTRPPRLLHICRESRAEGLRIYTKCPLPTIAPSQEARLDYDGEAEPAPPGGEGGEGGDRYFHLHPHLDVLYLPRPRPALDPAGYSGWARDFGRRMPAAAAAARRLAVDYVPAEVRRPWETYGKLCLLRGCARLEEAFLVISPSSSSSCPSSPSPLEGEVDELVAAGSEDGGGLSGMMGVMQEVEFVDPRGEPGEIMGIMERVRESFRFEGGGGNGGFEGWLGRGRVGVEDGDDGDGCKGKGGYEKRLELIPKAKKKKVLKGWGCRVGYTACQGSAVGLVV